MSQFYKDTVTGQWWEIYFQSGEMFYRPIAAPGSSITPSLAVADLVKGSMRLLNSLASGEEPSADEMNDAISALNSMLDSWGTERLMIFTLDHPEFALIPGQQDYTIGPGGDFDTYRPNSIDKILCRVTSTPQPYDLSIEILDDDKWADIMVKSLANQIPWGCHIHGEYPLNRLSFYPVPTIANHVIFYMWSPLGRVVDSTSDIVLPPGYERAIKYGLALEIAPEYGKASSPEVGHCLEVFKEARANIKRLNSSIPDLKSDVSVMNTQHGYYAIYRGQ